MDLEADCVLFSHGGISLLSLYLVGDFVVYRRRNEGAIFMATEKGIGPPREKDCIRHTNRIEDRLIA